MNEDTSSNILDVVREGSVEPSSLKPWDNAVQKRAALSFAVGAVLAAALMAIALFAHQPRVMDFFLLPVGLMLVALMVHAYSAFSGLAKALTTAKGPLLASAEEFAHGIDRIAVLKKQFERHHLNYAHDYLATYVMRMRNRMRFVLGSYEKLGIIPSVIAVFVYARETHGSSRDISADAWVAAWASVTLILLHAMVGYSVFISHKTESLALILKHAAAEDERESASSPRNET